MKPIIDATVGDPAFVIKKTMHEAASADTKNMHAAASADTAETPANRQDAGNQSRQACIFALTRMAPECVRAHASFPLDTDVRNGNSETCFQQPNNT